MSSDPKSNPFEPGLPRPDDPDAIDGKSNDRERERNLGFLLFFFPRERERESVGLAQLLFGKEVSWIFYFTGLQGLNEKRFFFWVMLILLLVLYL